MSIDSKTMKIILENSADSIVVTDINGIIEYVNPAFSDITGYSYEDAVGKTPRILKSGFHDHDFYRDLWSSILSGNKIKVIFHNRKKDGTYYYHDELISPVKQGNEISGFVSNGRDITHMIEQKEKLEEYCKFIDSVFETFSSHMSAYKIIKEMRYKI